MITEIRFSEMLDQWLLNIKPQIKDSSYIKYYNIIKTTYVLIWEISLLQKSQILNWKTM